MPNAFVVYAQLEDGPEHCEKIILEHLKISPLVVRDLVLH